MSHPRPIGGKLDTDALALLNRPADRDTLRAAAHELYQRGLTPTDISEALGLTAYAVRQLLGRTAQE